MRLKSDIRILIHGHTLIEKKRKRKSCIMIMNIWKYSSQWDVSARVTYLACSILKVHFIFSSSISHWWIDNTALFSFTLIFTIFFIWIIPGSHLRSQREMGNDLSGVLFRKLFSRILFSVLYGIYDVKYLDL